MAGLLSLAQLALGAGDCAALDDEISVVANAFRTLVPYLKLYSLYCTGYFAGLGETAHTHMALAPRITSCPASISRALRTTELLTKLRTDRPAVAEVIERTEAHVSSLQEAAVDLQLSSCLFRPVKRLCLYPLLLTSLLKEIESCEPSAEKHPSFRELSVAAEAVQSMASQVNEMVRLAENRCRLIEVSCSAALPRAG